MILTITAIEELSKKRSKIYIDNEFAFVLYKGELHLYNIYVDNEITEKDYHEIMTEVLPKRAKLRAMNLLTKRDYTNAQLRRKLEEGLYPKEIIDIALEYVASFKYTDDLNYALSYITYHECDKSKKRIEQDLINKGIDNQTIDKAWTKWEENGGTLDEVEMIKQILSKKHYDPKSEDYKEKQKVYAMLMRKGFSSENIRRAMSYT